ncbi:MAG: tyrosine-protein phosphatase [Eubacteriales bacterium]|nr:tyrosine-protein phosphatase [Eubacteriales bacterium]
MKLTREQRLINLPPITNIRSLGGYENDTLESTKAHKYVRSALIANVSEESLQKLYDFGIRAVVDLRSEMEIERNPHALNGYRDIAYYHINLIGKKDVNVMPDDVEELSDLYIFLVDQRPQKIKAIFEYFLKHQGQGVLFNCSAGKDRTGVIAAMLLDLAGIRDEVIVRDYSESFENNLPIYEFLQSECGNVLAAKLLNSNPEQMIRFLDHFRSRYKNTREYLLSLGFTTEEIVTLRNDFVNSAC